MFFLRNSANTIKFPLSKNSKFKTMMLLTIDHFSERNSLFMRILHIVLFWTIVLAGTNVFAADTQAIAVRLQAFQVLAQDTGGETLVHALEARPGDTIEYQVTYRNHGKTAATAVAATLPVPEGAMIYLDGSAAPKTVLASLDGKQFAPLPLTREVVRNGRRSIEPVPPAEYRFLRWELGDLPPARLPPSPRACVSAHRPHRHRPSWPARNRCFLMYRQHAVTLPQMLSFY